MYIDFHIHAYSDEIAERAMQKLKNTADVDTYTNGRLDDTRQKLTEWGFDYGVLLPIATKPAQQNTINNWAIENNNGNIISFGTVHPAAFDIEEELNRIAQAGLKGVKLHPAYQGVFLFDERYDMIFSICERLGLIVVLHMGYDPVSPKVMHAMPYDLRELALNHPDLAIVAAHGGGMNNWESSVKYLADCPNVYIDTAFLEAFISEEQFNSLLSAFSPDRILFGSDLPWSSPELEKNLIERSNLPESEKQKIYYKNAAQLLWLPV